MHEFDKRWIKYKTTLSHTHSHTWPEYIMAVINNWQFSRQNQIDNRECCRRRCRHHHRLLCFWYFSGAVCSLLLWIFSIEFSLRYMWYIDIFDSYLLLFYCCAPLHRGLDIYRRGPKWMDGWKRKKTLHVSVFKRVWMVDCGIESIANYYVPYTSVVHSFFQL